MKYLVPPIVIPVLLFIGVVAYGMLRPDYCRPCSGSSSERAATIARNWAGGLLPLRLLRFHTVKLLIAFGPKLLLIATSAAIATTGDQHPVDARGVVARVDGILLATEIGFEPGCETIGASVAGTPM
jgi:hypothetical protein